MTSHDGDSAVRASSSSKPVAGVVLAAGEGRRYGMPKALVSYGGELLVERAARVLADGDCASTMVVLGAAAARVEERAELSRVSTVLFNREWPTGMGSSVRTALDALEELSVCAVIVLPVDMPGVTATAVRRIAARAGSAALVAASYGDVRGHPVLLGRDHWPGVRACAVGDMGAREYLRQHETTLVACDDIAKGDDLDHPEHFRRPTP